MPINLPPINQQLIKGLEQARTEQLTNLSKLLGISVGNSLLASVENVEPVTAQQRSELLKHTEEQLQQLYRSPATPAVKAQINQLLEQQQLLKSPELKWVHLLVNNRALLTYTDKPPQPGQSLPIQLTDAQRLVQLGPIAPKLMDIALNLSATARSAAATSAGTLNPSNLSATAASAQLTSLAKNTLLRASSAINLGNNIQVHTNSLSANTNSLSRSDIQSQLTTPNLLATALRNLLPQKDQPQELYTALSKIQQLPISSRHELLSNSVQKALKTLADQLRSPVQLSNPKLLPMIVKNSGVFFENKLAQQLSTGTTTQTDNNMVTNRLTTQDLKGALLQLLNRVTQDLASSKQPDPNLPSDAAKTAAGAATREPLTSTVNNLLPPQLPGLLAFLQHLPERSGPELSNRVLRTQLLMLLQQHTLTSLGKVQLQQTQTLNHHHNQPDAAQANQSWLFEIPVKYGHEVHMLSMQLAQETVENNGEESEKNKPKIRQWTVTLSFDLPNAGKFYAQLNVLDENVSAKLWAEKPETLLAAKEKLANLRAQLEAQGVTVKQLICVHGAPPSTTISLQYSLVDVTT